MVQAFDEIPRDTDRVIFFPRAAGGAMIVSRSSPPRSSSSPCCGRRRCLCGSASPHASAPRRAARAEGIPVYDPGRERRAEQRARELLRSCVNEEEWEMYRDLGFLRVWGGQAGGPEEGWDLGGAPYAYLVYPHKPIVAYLPQTGQLLNEYCVEFPDDTKPFGSPRLPGLRRRPGQVDGAQGRRAAADRLGQPAPAGPPDRPAQGPARPLAPAPVGALAPPARRARGRRPLVARH